MRVSRTREPWEHYLVEDFLRPEDFDELKKWIDSLPNGRPKKRHAEWVTKSPKVVKLKEKFDLLLNDLDIVPKKPYQIAVEYNSVGQDYHYPIHSDSPTKFITLVLYISPEYGQGTDIYYPDKTFHSEVKWKKNSGLLFVRKDDTFHSYKSTFSNRKTLNIICFDADAFDRLKDCWRQ